MSFCRFFPIFFLLVFFFSFVGHVVGRLPSPPHNPTTPQSPTNNPKPRPKKMEDWIQLEATLVDWADFASGFGTSFMMIMATEIGDRTFFIAAIMAMKHPRLIVWFVEKRKKKRKRKGKRRRRWWKRKRKRRW